MDGATALIERLLEAFTYLQPWRAGASDCTYCRRPGNKGRVCYSTFTSRLTCADYDGAFLERGFMRSGTSLYRPLNAVSCCPNLVVRLDALAFRPSRGQRAALRRVAECLAGRGRALALPAVVTDPLLRCMALTREGRAREAAEAVLRNRSERTQACAQTPGVLALTAALVATQRAMASGATVAAPRDVVVTRAARSAAVETAAAV
jgi:arginyl-tRNA--protein-N-Asp/Glu arginylyltransferase